MGKLSGSENADMPQGSLRLDHGATKKIGLQRRNPRIALYSHDTLGLGHLRRNLLIAQSLSESDLKATSLLITGAHEANFFSLPAGTDCLTLPRFQKDGHGKYISGQLGISVNDLVRLRADSICSAMRVFLPDVFIVDKVPTGAFGELLPSLRFLRQQTNAKCVLGLRDILDAPETVLAEWEAAESHKAIIDFFDEIWVYGDTEVYNPAKEYHWPSENAEKIRYTGYLNQSCRLARTEGQAPNTVSLPETQDDQVVVCTLGGGQDGYELARAFVDSLPDSGFQGVLLTGPFMPSEYRRSLQEIVAKKSNLRVIKFTVEADQIISRADRVIAMGGYNTVCSLLSFQKPSLLVPRVSPRSEQWIRAQRLRELGFVDVLHPDKLSSAALNQWLLKDFFKPPKALDAIDLNGLARIEELCRTLIRKNRKNPLRSSRELV